MADDRKRTRSIGWRAWRMLCVAAALCAPTLAFAHPHVWVTVRSQLIFNKEGRVESIVHDWVFDEMYSSYATQGLAPAGQLVTRDLFAALAKENAGSLAEIGYFTSFKIGSKEVEYGPVEDYWMEERPDHLVAFHVVLPLKTPASPGKYSSMLVADPEYFIDFEYDDTDAITLVSAPKGCSSSISRPKPLEGEDKKKLDESFFSGLAPGSNFGFKMAPRAIIACP
jgi:ABC-type uncharacterized transport system substrate-binding protein